MYSPKKKLTHFYQSYQTRNQELKQLRNYLSRPHVTYEDLELARSHLERLRDEHDNLILQEFTQMRNVCISSSEAVSQLNQSKNLLARQLVLKESQIQRLEQLRAQYQKKINQTEEELKLSEEAKKQANFNLTTKDSQVLDIQEVINKLLINIKIDKEALQKIENDHNTLLVSIKEAEDRQKLTKQRVSEQNQTIIQERSNIKDIQHNLITQNLQIQNLTLKIQNQFKNQENLKHRFQIANKKIQQHTHNQELFTNQSLTSSNIEQLIDLGQSNVEAQRQEYLRIQNDNKRLEIEIKKQKMAQQEINRAQQEKQQKIIELKQKNQTIRSLLNTIFQQDSQILRIIADKKVYPQSLSVLQEKTLINEAKNEEPFQFTKIPQQQQFQQTKQMSQQQLAKGLETAQKPLMQEVQKQIPLIKQDQLLEKQQTKILQKEQQQTPVFMTEQLWFSQQVNENIELQVQPKKSVEDAETSDNFYSNVVQSVINKYLQQVFQQ